MSFNLKFAISNPKLALDTIFERLFPVDDSIKRFAKWKYGKLPRVDISDIVSTELTKELKVFRPFDRMIGTWLAIALVVLASIPMLLETEKELKKRFPKDED